MANQPPIPLSDPIAQPRRANIPKDQKDVFEGLITDPWVKWFQTQTQTIQSTPQSAGSVSLTNQSASIAATAIPSGSLSSGVFRVSYYNRVTQAATTSSGLQMIFGWTDSGIACSKTFTNVTGNTTATTDTGTLLIYADSASPITYSTVYASVGGTVMKYKLIVVLEQVNI